MKKKNQERMNTEREIVHIGMFGAYVPHYRLGLYKKLQECDDMTFTICAPDAKPGSFLHDQHPTKSFPYINVWTKQIKLPFIRNSITLQPYAVCAMLKGSFDVFVMPDDFLRPSVWLNLILTRLRRRKVCLWGQGISHPPVPLSWFLRGIMYKLAHAIIHYTENVREQWIDRGMPSKKMFVAYNALDTNISEKIKDRISEDDLRKFRSQHGLESENVVIFCGRLFLDKKRPDILVRAMKSVVERLPDARLVIIGDGPDKNALQKIVSELRLSQVVTLTGAIHDEQVIARYMLASKVAVIPGNAGLGVQHAFGYGLPLITHNNVNTQTPEIELVTNGLTGILCPEGDVSAFAQAICRLLTNNEERGQMSTNALRIIREKYNVNNMAKGIIDAVRYALSRK